MHETMVYSKEWLPSPKSCGLLALIMGCSGAFFVHRGLQHEIQWAQTFLPVTSLIPIKGNESVRLSVGSANLSIANVLTAVSLLPSITNGSARLSVGLSNLSITTPSRQISSSNGTLCSNSATWLAGPRHDNSVVPNATNTMLKSWLVDYTEHLLLPSSGPPVGPVLTTVCTPDSSFVQPDIESVRHWYIRIMFAVIYHHQYGPARMEAQRRLTSELFCPVGNFNYECDNAKFLVAEMNAIGMGAGLRTSMAKLILTGFMTNRVVLFINENGWALASCTRRDWQCVLQPLSPCTLTKAELRSAKIIENGDLHRLVVNDTKLRNFNYSDIAHERVLRVNLVSVPFREMPRVVLRTVHAAAGALIDKIDMDNSEQMVRHRHHLKQALQLVLDAAGKDQPFTESDLFNTILVFLFRPNRKSHQAMRHMVRNILPNNFDGARTVGLPIRASDKCGGESQCLTFEQHLQAGAKSWLQWRDNYTTASPTSTFVLVTSESKEMKLAFENYMRGNITENATRTLAWTSPHLLTNPYDATPGTGALAAQRKKNFTEDEAMLSSLTTFHLQLHARVTVGNCCSNFHAVLKSALRVGCGHRHNFFHCLQDDDDPLFAICCRMGPVQHGGKKEFIKCETERAAALRNRTDIVGLT